MSEPVEEIWRNYRQKLLNFVRSRVGDATLAEDIVQEVFARVVDKLATLRNDERMASWLYQVTRNVIIDHFRKERPSEELDANIAQPEQDPLLPVRQELQQCLTGMIDALPEKYRQAVSLAELDGLPQQELADRLGISLSGAKSRVQRGRRMLKEKMLRCCNLDRDHQGSVVDFARRKGGKQYC